MKTYPSVTQKIILRYRDQILILRHKNGSYDFPGGQLEWGEAMMDSLRREIMEELGLRLDIKPDLFHVWNYISKNGKRHSVMIYYFYKLEDQNEPKSPEKIQILWLDEKEMKQIVKDHDFVKRMFCFKAKKSPYSMFFCN